MDKLRALQHLSLINKVTTELDNHLGIGDKTLAEFVVALSEGAGSAAAFHAALAANGADLPLDFCATLLTVIVRLRPAAPGGGGDGGSGAAGRGGAAGPPGAGQQPPPKYPALAVPDSRERADAMSRELLGGRDPLANPRRASVDEHRSAHLPLRVFTRSPPTQRRPALPGRAAAGAGGAVRV